MGRFVPISLKKKAMSGVKRHKKTLDNIFTGPSKRILFLAPVRESDEFVRALSCG